MNLFGRRATTVEMPYAGTALATGLYAGSWAGAASADCGDADVDEGGAEHRQSVDTGEGGPAAHSGAAVDSAAASWSGPDGAGGGNWWDGGAEGGGNWSVDVSAGGG